MKVKLRNKKKLVIVENLTASLFKKKMIKHVTIILMEKTITRFTKKMKIFRRKIQKYH